MRRPICAAALLYVAVLAVVLAGRTRGAPTYEALDAEQVAVAGYVDWKEHRLSRGEEVPVISLAGAVVLQEDQIAILEQFLSDSEKIPQYKLHRIWKDNREKLRREDATGIDGVLCYMETEELPAMGSLVIVRGSFRTFTHASNPGEFDGAEYYRIMGQQGRIMKCFLVKQSKTCDGFRECMYRLRAYLSMLMDASYGAEDASVMKAMLLGEKGTLDAEIKELYRQNGIIHVLAISGLHLSVIGMGCHSIFRKMRLPIAVNIILSLGLMYCYGTMTGMGVSMLRAYIMFTLHLCARLAGRTYDLLTAVSVAAAAVLMQQPLYLGHSGFLFSFGAVCGIGIFLPAAMENLFGQGKAEQMLLSGIVISLSTLPVYLCFYYEFPPYSVILNLIVIPCMTLVLLCGLVSLGMAAWFLPFGKAAAYPVHLLLGLYEKCCTLCLRLPDSVWVTGCPEKWQVLLFVSTLAALTVWNRRLSRIGFWQIVLCALLALSVRMPMGLQITMLDVGQGDCIYVAEDDGIHMLIDAGSLDESDVAGRRMLPYLKYEGVSYLDAVAVTHPDSDHINGICGMLQEMDTCGITVGRLYLPDVGERGRNEQYCKLEQLAKEAGVPVSYIGLGDSLHCGGVMLTCIHPEKGWNSEDVNAGSTVFYMTYGEFSALLTGDLEGEGERKVLERIEEGILGGNKVDITLLKVAHHGSRYSTSEAFLEAVNPRIALISAGRDNRYGHPHEELLDRLETAGCLVLRTQQSGAVTVYVHNGKVRVETFMAR